LKFKQKKANVFVESLRKEMTKIAKVYLPNNEIRKFSASDKTFEEFNELVFKGNQIQEIILQYQNSEMKWIPFNSQTEWTGAVSENSSNILRIKVIVPENMKLMFPLHQNRNFSSCSTNYAQFTKNLPADLLDFFHQA
jgi:hypothetical protein